MPVPSSGLAPSSSLAPGFGTLLPTVTVEIAFTTNPSAENPVWQNVSAYVLDLRLLRGRQRELDQVQAGTCDLRLDNGDRRFDPTYTHSPYYPYVIPMRKLRVSVEWNGVSYTLFTGFIERWQSGWETPKWGSVQVTAVDGLAMLAQAQITGTFPEEVTGARISRVLSAALWPLSTPTNIGDYWHLDTSQLGNTTLLSYANPNSVVATGQSLVQTVTFGPEDEQRALAHVLETVDAERGLFFIDGPGRAIFHDRLHRYTATSQVTFADTANSTTRIPYRNPQPEFAVDTIVNEAIVTRNGGIAQTSANAASREKYQRRSLSLSLPLTTDAEALLRASFETFTRGDPRLEFLQLDLMPQGFVDAWPWALGLELGDRVTVEAAPGSWSSIVAETISRGCFIEQIAHDATPNRWTTSFRVSPADQYDQFWRLGTSQLDTTTLVAY